MYIPAQISIDGAMNLIRRQFEAVQPSAAQGIDVEVRAHKRPRSFAQNKFLMAIMQEVVKFHHTTGFRPDNIPVWAMRTDILKEFFKAKFGIESTAKLSTAEFSRFCDSIQNMMLDQSNGMYEILIPEDACFAALINDGESK